MKVASYSVYAGKTITGELWVPLKGTYSERNWPSLKHRRPSDIKSGKMQLATFQQLPVDGGAEMYFGYNRVIF
jgi:hypothetical protein